MTDVSNAVRNEVTLSNLEPALAEWTAILGPEGVRIDIESRDTYSRSCGHVGNAPIAILFPRKVSDVQEIMKVAQKYSISVYPVSRGKNSGYGSASPSSHDCAVVDLRLMNRILEVNEELAYTVVEPGVTQEQLQKHLKQIGSRLWMDVTGAAPDSSLIGNLVERGYGLSPYGDRFLHSCGMMVVLPSGELLKTGFGHIPDSKVTHLYKWGVGPYLDGIFTQGNFGIVVGVGLWLMLKPEAAEVLSINFKTDEVLLDSIEKLRDLKLRGLFPSPVHIANDLRVISVFERYPFAEMHGKVPLSTSELERLKKRWQVGAWNCIAGLWGAKSQVRSMKIELRKALRGIVSPIFVPRKILKFVARHKWLHWLPGTRDLKSKMGLLQLLEGVPSSAPQNGAYWRKREGIPPAGPDLERDNCGVIWVSPMVPSTRKDLGTFIKITRDVCEAHSFETNVTVSLLSDRACCCTVAIIFDRAIRSELEKAEACHRVLLDQYLSHGFPPYRAGSDWGELIDSVLNPADSFMRLCSTIKRALDPKSILAPNRYGIK